MNINKKHISQLALLSVVAFMIGCGSNATPSANQTAQPSAALAEVGASSQAVAEVRPVAVFNLENDTFDFGVVQEGVKVEHVFDFVNTGEAPLIISNVLASCGCTTPEYSKHPIAPGEKGTVKVMFDSNGQLGKQHKIITVMSNAENRNMLMHLRGEVKTKI